LPAPKIRTTTMTTTTSHSEPCNSNGANNISYLPRRDEAGDIGFTDVAEQLL
jgi:hypothetical protein